MRVARYIFVLIAVLLPGPHLRATTLQRMTLEELAAATPAIARVRILASEPRIDGGRIWTLWQMEVTESFKGSLAGRISVRLLGGKAGGFVSKVEGVPRFSLQEEAILFLQRTPLGDWTVVSWVQGTFRIARANAAGTERVTQDTAGVALFDPATRRFEKGEVRNLPLREFRTRLAQAIARGERSPR